MKLRAILRESGENELDQLASMAKTYCDNHSYIACQKVIDTYWQRRQAGEEPGSLNTDGAMTMLKKDLDWFESLKAAGPVPQGYSPEHAGDYSSEYSDEYSESEESKESGSGSGSDNYTNPDEFYRSRSTTFIYGGTPPKLFARAFPKTHTELVREPDIEQYLVGDDHNPRAWPQPTEREDFLHLGLMGRVSSGGDAVSVWNTDQTLVEQFMLPAAMELIKDGYLKKDAIAYAPCYDKPVQVNNIHNATVHVMSPESIEKVDLQRRMHMAVGAEKEAIRKKLGMVKPPMKANPTPGRKWWATTSESLRQKMMEDPEVGPARSASRTVIDKATRYQDPDELYRAGDYTTFIYGGEPPLLFVDEIEHFRMLKQRDIRNHIYGTHPVPVGHHDPRSSSPNRRNAMSLAILGRVGYGKDGIDRVSIWNYDKSQVDHLYPMALQALTKEGYVDGDTLIASPLNKIWIRYSEMQHFSTKELTPEQEQEIDLRRRLHMAVGAEKEAIRDQLGMTKPASKAHPLAKSMVNAGLAAPGHKWWAPTSERFERQLSGILGC